MTLQRRMVKLEQRAGLGVAKRPVIYYQIVQRGADGILSAETHSARILETPNGATDFLERAPGESETAFRHRVEIVLGDST
jgi:hypothetical protein